jgi:hypothetical protein
VYRHGEHKYQSVSLTYTTPIMRSFYEFRVRTTSITWTLEKCHITFRELWLVVLMSHSPDRQTDGVGNTVPCVAGGRKVTGAVCWRNRVFGEQRVGIKWVSFSILLEERRPEVGQCCCLWAFEGENHSIYITKTACVYCAVRTE